MMKKLLLISLFFLLCNLLNAQQNVFHRSDAATVLWQNNTNNPWFYQSDNNNQNRPDNPSFTGNDVFFGHNNELNMDVNTNEWFRIRSLTLQSTANQQRTFTNSGTAGITIIGSGTRKIENLSSATHIFDVRIGIDVGESEINPINGNLIFQKQIFMNHDLNIWGNNGNRVTFNDVLSNTGRLRLRQNSIAVLNANNTYTGNTEIDQGELWIGENGNIASGTTVFVGNGGQTSNVAKFFLADPDGGQNFSRAITVNNGNGLTRYIGSLNTSGTNAISGAISKSNSANLNFEVVNAGGTLSLTGGLSAGTNTTILRKFGPGRLIISSSDFNTNTLGEIFLRNGTLEVDLFPSRFGGSRAITFGDDGLSTFKINETSGNYSNTITINSNNGVIEFNSTSGNSFTGTISFNSNILSINNQSVGNLTLSGNQTGTGVLNINSTGSGAVILTRTSYDRTGNTIVNSGELRLSPSNPGTTFASKIVLNGGTLSTSGITSGRTFTSSATLQVNSSSNITLGTSGHTLTFANSSGESWTGTLTITGWNGTAGVTGSGTVGRIFIGNNNSSLTTAQLNSINFVNYAPGAELTASGELVPRDFLRFYSVSSGSANTFSNWNSQRNGSGFAPTAFNTPRAFFYVQNGHTMTTSEAMSMNGANSNLIVESGGTLQSDFAITLSTTSNFTVENGATYVHNNTTSYGSSIFFTGSNVTFELLSNFEIRKTNSNLPTVSTYGNVIIDLDADPGAAMSYGGNINLINGNLAIKHTRGRAVRFAASTSPNISINGNFEVYDNAIIECVNGAGNPNISVNGNFLQYGGSLTLSISTGNCGVTVNGNVELNGGTFRFQNTNTGVGRLIMNGQNVTISSELTIAGNTPDNSGFYFNHNGLQNVTIGQAFTSGNYRDRFFYNASQTTINETYNGTVAQETVNGTGATPLAGYSAWPLTGDAIKNFTVNNAAGVTLRNDRAIQGDLTLANGTLSVGTNSTLLFQGDDLVKQNGFLNVAATNATLELDKSDLIDLPTNLFNDTDIFRLRISGAGGVKANQNLTITGQLHLNNNNPNETDGLLDMVIGYGNYATQYSVNSTDGFNNLNSHILTLGSDATITGNADVTGKIRRSGFTSGIPYAFGNQNTLLTFTSVSGSALPTSVTVVTTKGDKGLHVDKDGDDSSLGDENQPNESAAVKRLYQVLRTGGDAPTRMNIRLAYDSSELNGNDASNLVLWDHHLPYDGVSPHEHGQTNRTANYVELTGHGLFYLAQENDPAFTKYWMISDKETTDILWIGAVSGGSWDILSNWSDGIERTSTDKIVIPSNTTYQHELIISDNKQIGTIEVKEEGQITLNDGVTLTINSGPAESGGTGSWSNQGTLVAGNNSKVLFTYSGATLSGKGDFHHLEVANGADLLISGNADIKIKGNLTLNGTIDALTNDNTITFNGNNQSIPATNGSNPGYRNIEIDQVSEDGEATLTGSIEVNGTLTITQGKLLVNNHTLSLKGAFPINADKIITNNQSRLEFRNTGSGNHILPNFEQVSDFLMDTDLTLEASAPLNIHSDLRVLKGKLNLGPHAWNRFENDGGTLSIGSNAKLDIGGTNSLPESFLLHEIHEDSEVIYSGTTQMIKKPNSGAAYGTLRLAGSGDKTLDTNEDFVEVSKDLVIEGGHLKVGVDKTLKVVNRFENISGLATFENNSSLLQVNDIINIGNIRYKRKTGILKNLDFVYWGSMVQNQVISSMWMTNAFETYYRFNSSTNSWNLISGNTIMNPGIGYISRARTSTTGWGSGTLPPEGLTWTANFNARPNNGNIEVDIIPNRYHLLSNPYPSAIDIEEFVKQGGSNIGNADTGFDDSPFLPTIYIWTQANGINNNQYQGTDYATLNLFTGTSLNPSGSDFTISKNVGAGQGFFIATKEGTLPPKAIFRNEYRLANNNSNFTKPAPIKNNSTPLIMQRYKFQISNALGNKKLTAIVHHPQGTASFNGIHDSQAFNGNSTLHLFTIADNKRLAINVTNPIQITDIIPLGYTSTQAGNHTISMTDIENLPVDQEVYLWDTTLQLYHNIKQNPYIFTSSSGTFIERFKIVFQNQTLGNPEEFTANWIVFANENNIHIQTGNDLIDQILIYDLNGRLLYQKQNIINNNLLVPWNSNKQVLFVHIICKNGISYKKKVLLP